MNSNFFSRFFSPLRLSFEVASMSACGLVRLENQDALLVDTKSKVFAVMDGMGGGDAGREASQLLRTALSQAVMKAHHFEACLKAFDRAIQTSHTRIHEIVVKEKYRQMGTTCTLLAFEPETGREAVIKHIGDSRVYRFRKGELTCLTHDHTVAGELSRNSPRSQFAQQLSDRQHPLAHILTRVVGNDEPILVDELRLEVLPDDDFLMCTDGVHDMISDEMMAATFSTHASAESIAAQLSDAILAAGAQDNYSFIVIRSKGGVK